MHLRASAILVFVFLVACGGASMTPEPPGAFDASGLKLVIGVTRTRTFTVGRDGEVTSSQTGATAMKFVGHELRLPDGSKALLTLDGDELRANDKHLGAFQGDALAFGALRLSVTDDGTVNMTKGDETKKMRLHFEGAVVGHRRPALMMVAVVFALYVAMNPGATFERFADD